MNTTGIMNTSYIMYMLTTIMRTLTVIISDFDVYNYSLFLVVSYLIYCSYPPFKYILSKNDKFRSYDENKQYYIIKNLIKTFAMMIIFVFFIIAFVPNIINNIWKDSHNRIIGAFYVGNDLAGLFAVPNLPKSTKFHHYTSVSLYTIICILSTEHEDNIAKLIVIYTVFSCIPYLVNNYLALRFFYNRDKTLSLRDKNVNRVLDFNRLSAYYIYLICCICNWIYHVQFLVTKVLANNFTISYLIYYMMLMPIVNDDIILLKWLKYNRLEM